MQNELINDNIAAFYTFPVCRYKTQPKVEIYMKREVWIFLKREVSIYLLLVCVTDINANCVHIQGLVICGMSGI